LTRQIFAKDRKTANVTDVPPFSLHGQWGLIGATNRSFIMRVLPLVLAFVPGLVLADEITLTSKVTDVVLYPNGAKVTREVRFAAPGGSHVLRLLDLPEGTPMESVRVKVGGARMGAITMREDYVPPRGDQDSVEVKAARDEVERLEEAVRAKGDEATALRLAKEAADTRIGFLRQLGEGEALTGATADTLRDVARMVGEETLAARQAALAAEAKARAVDRAVADLVKELSEAQKALDALVPDTAARNMVEVEISAPSSIEGKVTLSYTVDEGGWSPIVDAHLTRGDKPVLELRRGALVGQYTGENWTDVNLTLTTNQPLGQTEPGNLWPERRRIEDPAPPMPKAVSRTMDTMDTMAGMADPVIEMPVVVEEAAAMVDLDGLSVTYTYPDRIDLASDADNVRIELGSIRLDAEIQAFAVPRRDATAFFSVRTTNTSGEIILPAMTQYFLDGEFVGQNRTAQIAAGQEARFFFGPIEGLRLSRLVDRNEGDRGVLSRSNEQSEAATIKVENLTGRAWPMRVLDQVPYSEQEDLVITWNAQPRPSEVDVNDEKGIFAWEFEIAPGETRSIALNQRIQWPDGKVLR
jgi:uncharacterized protein (TIGR02231 family)